MFLLDYYLCPFFCESVLGSSEIGVPTIEKTRIKHKKTIQQYFKVVSYSLVNRPPSAAVLRSFTAAKESLTARTSTRKEENGPPEASGAQTYAYMVAVEF